MVTPRDWISSSRGALQEEYNILSLILQLYPGMLYMKTKKRKKEIILYNILIHKILLIAAYLCFLCNLLHEYV